MLVGPLVQVVSLNQRSFGLALTPLRSIEQLEEIIAEMRNKLKIWDWEKVEAKYKELNLVLAKNTKDLIDSDTGKPPRAYMKTVTELEDIVVASWANRKADKLSKLRSRALGNLKQSIKRTNREKVTISAPQTHQLLPRLARGRLLVEAFHIGSSIHTHQPASGAAAAYRQC